MDRLYDNLEEAKAFALSFTNFVYIYDDLLISDFMETVCPVCKKEIQTKDYLFPKASCRKPTGILSTYEFGISRELRDDLIARFDITEKDFRPIRSKKGEVVYYQISPSHVMLPLREENEWILEQQCPRCGSLQYDRPPRMNEKKEQFFLISPEALEDMHDLNITHERFRRHMPLYVISRRVYDYLTEKYPQTHYYPFFLDTRCSGTEVSLREPG